MPEGIRSKGVPAASFPLRRGEAHRRRRLRQCGSVGANHHVAMRGPASSRAASGVWAHLQHEWFPPPYRPPIVGKPTKQLPQCSQFTTFARSAGNRRTDESGAVLAGPAQMPVGARARSLRSEGRMGMGMRCVTLATSQSRPDSDDRWAGSIRGVTATVGRVRDRVVGEWLLQASCVSSWLVGRAESSSLACRTG